MNGGEDSDPKDLRVFTNAGPVAAATLRCAVESTRLRQLPVAAFLPVWNSVSAWSIVPRGLSLRWPVEGFKQEDK